MSQEQVDLRLEDDGDISKKQLCLKPPNAQLSDEAKLEKRRQKKKLKFYRNVAKLENRIKHSICRRDLVVEAQARDELETLLKSKDHELDTIFIQEQNQGSKVTQCEANAKKCIISIFNKLLQHAESRANQNHASIQMTTAQGVKAQEESIKKVQTAHARNLLRHMTKGTQTKEMLSNQVALWGYTRQKFVQRAELVLHSICQLELLNSGDSSTPEMERQREIRERMQNQILRVKRICSVACGPGSDMVGILSYFEEKRRIKNMREASVNLHDHLIDRVVCLDFAIEQWQCIMSRLYDIVCPHLVGEMETMFVDITAPLIVDEQTKENDRLKEIVETYDLFLFSYILSETRHKWETFVMQVFQRAKNSSLFYFAEPSPWQLHRLISLLESQESPFNHAWLDSSMNFPELQPLDSRLGPAVLMIMKLNC